MFIITHILLIIYKTRTLIGSQCFFTETVKILLYVIILYSALHKSRPSRACSKEIDRFIPGSITGIPIMGRIDNNDIALTHIAFIKTNIVLWYLTPWKLSVS